MSDSENDEITFTGVAPGKFIAAVARHARSEGKEKDNEWQADFAASCFQGSGKVLKWYRTLDEDVQADWEKLSKAILETFGKSEVKEQDLNAEEEPEEEPQSREDQYTPESEKTEEELFETPSASGSFAPSPASSAYNTPLPSPAILRTGRIKLVDDDDAKWAGWISKRKNGNGAHIACDHASDALVVQYESRCGFKERIGVKSKAGLQDDDSCHWLGVTWPGRHSDDWTTNPTTVAAFATITQDKSGEHWVSSSNRDQGATEHLIWRLGCGEDTMEIEYLEDNGKMHPLGTVVACYGSMYLSQRPDCFIHAMGGVGCAGKKMRKVRLVFQEI